MGPSTPQARVRVLVPGRVLEARKPGQQPAVTAGLPYLEALWPAGATEMVVAPRPLDPEGASALLAQAGGLMLLGGPDLDPATYGEAPHPATYGVRPEQDAFEIALVRAAMADDVPVLAICRGLQVLNVALGGDLYQDLGDRDDGDGDGAWPRRPEGFPAPAPGTPRPLVPVNVEPGCRVAVAMGATEINGAHAHHQAVRRVGEGLTVTGRAPDGVVEAVEHERGWVVGVQWHPEDTAARDHLQARLFEAFVAQAGERAARVGVRR